MIDLKSRSRLSEDNKFKSLIYGIRESVSEAIKNQKQESNEPIVKSLDKIGQALVVIFNQIKSFKIDFPKIYQVKGNVNIDSLPAVEIKNLNQISKEISSLRSEFKYLIPKPYPTSFMVDNLSEQKEYFDLIVERIDRLILAIGSMPTPKIEIPTVNIPKSEQVKQIGFDKKLLNPLEELLSDIREGVANLVKKDDVKFPKSIEIANYRQMVPQPVTHISMNSLQGFIKTTSATVGTSLVQLPIYGVLANRRSLYIYNNSSNTVYVGGSDVTTSNGIPVPANSTSPIIDAGVNMVFYAIASTNGNDVRVMEVSDEASGR